MVSEASPRASEGTPSELPLAEIRIRSPLSVVVPTFRERANLPHLVARIDALRVKQRLDVEVIFVDDDSQDGTEEWVNEHAPEWVRLVVRREERGLATAVVQGMEAARHPVIVVMDADLSHPPERIPAMILALESGQQFVIGSRYVPGGSTDDEWGFFRWLNSKVATLLAWPLTDAKDPMAGFFALRRSDFERRSALNPVGYKIGLELIVKCGLHNVGEVPIHFADRAFGQSKLTLKEQFNYLVHLRRLYMFKYAGWSSFVQFAVVGLSGVFVNLAILQLFLWLGTPELVAVAFGICVSMVTNFALNRRFTFESARDAPWPSQFVGFCTASSIGMLVNFGVVVGLKALWPGFAVQLAALVGIAAGTIFNFVGNRYWVFRRKGVRGGTPP
ncbi:MAG: glycosyltransferase [Myxococcota bacterium]